jgi:histidyl-tRNA synthetase
VARVSEVYERWGFEPLETPAFEYVDALGKFLPDTDRPNEGVLALQDDDDQWMALRYDLTAPLARFAAQNWEILPKPFRRYAFGSVWRNEKPGPAASANSSSATPTPWARTGPRPTPRSSPWPVRA